MAESRGAAKRAAVARDDLDSGPADPSLRDMYVRVQTSGLAVGALSVWWALAADPATGGDLDQRLSYLAGLMSSDRVSLAFVVDIALFSVWQAYLINELDEDAPAACKFVPFWGLGAWLLL